LQVVLDAVVHLAHQHLALRDRRLEARLLRGALLGDVGGDDEELVGRLALRGDERQQASVPDVLAAADDEPVFARRHFARGERVRHVATARGGDIGREDVLGRLAEQASGVRRTDAAATALTWTIARVPRRAA
jgi:hypothetical protein